MTGSVQLSIVVPCYNEEQVLLETMSRLADLLTSLIRVNKIAESSRTIFVDDGSSDRTWQLIEAAAATNPLIGGIKLSRNRGHQLALLAGLLTVPGDVVISVDADLQDDLNAIEKMLDAHRDGARIVLGVRSKRTTDSWFKRSSAEWYYLLLSKCGVEVTFNHADYRLMDRCAIDALSEFGEANVFLRGLIPQLGYRTATVYYERSARFAGESKYTFRKMLALAWDGITSFSAVPLRFITALGLLISLAAMGVSIWAIVVRLFTTSAIPGWASTVIPMYFLGGIQLLSLGVMGEYVAKIYMESKRRPKFFVEKTV
jgi:glycosyltransferase involved in cell wall biosynthesis